MTAQIPFSGIRGVFRSLGVSIYQFFTAIFRYCAIQGLKKMQLMMDLNLNMSKLK